MSVTFTKLFSSITESTVWCEPDRTRLVWICMLAMADRHGRVFASIPGLANRARVPVEDCRTAITTFLSPDRESRTELYEGRRIAPMDGGWKLLNHEKYRSIRDEEATKESKRNYINNRRAAERAAAVENVDRGRDNAEAYTEAYTEADKEGEKSAANVTRYETKASRKRAASPEIIDCPLDVAEQVWKDWVQLRKDKRARVSITALDGAREEANKAGMSLESFLRIWCRRGSQGLEASWLTQDERKSGETAYQRNRREFMTEHFPNIAAKAPTEPATAFFEVQARLIEGNAS